MSARLVGGTRRTPRGVVAITAYFNPAGYRNRLLNFRTFRQHLGVPLVAVEFSPTADFDLQRDDADVLIQITDGDVMWQKERLLNIALATLPDCEAVAWLDCDVLLLAEDWVKRTLRRLDSCKLVQPFSRVTETPPGARPMVRRGDVARLSFAYQYQTGEIGQRELATWRVGDDPVPLHCGYAWVARRELLTTHGFYDASILGGATREIATAALGELDALAACRTRTPAQLEHVLAWAEPFASDVAGDVGCIHGDLTHLWHGSTADRGYGMRYQVLVENCFNPRSDIEHTGGCWRWASDKPGLHEGASRYFASRREDDDGAREAHATQPGAVPA
jgi:hypothetical protein